MSQSYYLMQTQSTASFVNPLEFSSASAVSILTLSMNWIGYFLTTPAKKNERWVSRPYTKMTRTCYFVMKSHGYCAGLRRYGRGWDWLGHILEPTFGFHIRASRT